MKNIEFKKSLSEHLQARQGTLFDKQTPRSSVAFFPSILSKSSRIYKNIPPCCISNSLSIFLPIQALECVQRVDVVTSLVTQSIQVTGGGEEGPTHTEPHHLHSTVKYNLTHDSQRSRKVFHPFER